MDAEKDENKKEDLPTQPPEVQPVRPAVIQDELDKQELSAEVVAVESNVEQVGAAAPSPVQASPTAFTIKKPEGKLKRLLKSKKFWLMLSLSLLVALIALWFIQPTRVWIVNLFGAKVPVTITTRTVAEPGRPSSLIKNVDLVVNGSHFASNEAGTAQTSVTYGTFTVTASKAGYEQSQFTDFYDFNPFFSLFDAEPKNGAQRSVDMSLKGVGLPLSFVAKDWLTGAPVTVGSFSVGDVVAQPNDQGIVSLLVPPTDGQTVKVVASFNEGYNNSEFEVKIQETPLQEQLFVPAGKDYFVSKRSGQLVVYSSNLDGSAVNEVVPASPNETTAIDFAVSPSGKFAVLASTREGKKDASGQLLQKLYVVNLASNQLTAVDEGQWFNFIDWSGDTLAYVTAPNLSSPQRLASINVANAKKTDLSSAASFGVARLILGAVVYQFYSANTNPELRVVSVNGGTEKNIGNNVDILTQTDFDKVAYRTADGAWHQYDVNKGQVTNISAPTSMGRAYLSTGSPDGQTRLLIDNIDGKNTLITESVASGQEKQIYGAAGLQGPIRWVGAAIVFRVVSAQESADYVVSANGGEAKKITDVTDTPNLATDNYFGFF